MRVKQPEPFDPSKEYRPGERCVYRGMVLIARDMDESRPKVSRRPRNPILPTVRPLPRIDRDVCTGAHLQCDKYNRTDRKTIFWRLAYPKTVRTNKKLER